MQFCANVWIQVWPDFYPQRTERSFVCKKVKTSASFFQDNSNSYLVSSSREQQQNLKVISELFPVWKCTFFSRLSSFAAGLISVLTLAEMKTINFVFSKLRADRLMAWSLGLSWALISWRFQRVKVSKVSNPSHPRKLKNLLLKFGKHIYIILKERIMFCCKKTAGCTLTLPEKRLEVCECYT